MEYGGQIHAGEKEKAGHPETVPGVEAVPEGHWFRIAEKLAKESGKVPDPLEIRAAAVISALGLPSGETSALTTNERGERVDPEKDRVIAEYLTNYAGAVIDKEAGVVSNDFRDLYPNGIPEELKNALDPETRAIMEIEYEHAADTRERFGNTENDQEVDCPVHYFRLPGGIDLFLRGYAHDRAWQKNHGRFLQKANTRAQVICIEGFMDKPFGESLDARWGDISEQRGHYDALMHEAVEGGFNGLFAEVDARDKSKVEMDSDLFFHFPNSPAEFFSLYLAFLQREHPRLAGMLGSPAGLKKALIAQSTTYDGVLPKVERSYRYQQGRLYGAHPYLSPDGEVSPEPTLRELGQLMFTDALAALKLHLIGKLMADDKLPKGPIIDYEGASHISSKSFFLRYPWYAAEVVLRTVNELMAGKAEEKNWFLKLFRKGDIKEVYKVFAKPDWADIFREIVRLPMKRVEEDPSKTKTVDVGPNQRKLIDRSVDILEIYNIDPKQAMPTDKEIRQAREKLASMAHSEP